MSIGRGMLAALITFALLLPFVVGYFLPGVLTGYVIVLLVAGVVALWFAVYQILDE